MFTRMYNYAKQKHLPSSFLAKLRYFIERETKVRRNVAVMGSVLRNSKWSDLSHSNINLLQYSFEINHYIHIVPVSIVVFLFATLNFNHIFCYNLFFANWISTPTDNMDFIKTLFETISFLIPSTVFMLTTFSSHLFFLLTPTTWYSEKFTNSQTALEMNTRNFSFWDNLDTTTWDILKQKSHTYTNLNANEFQLTDHENNKIDFKLEYYLYSVIASNLDSTRPILNETPLLFTYPKAYSLATTINTDKKTQFHPLFNDEIYGLTSSKVKGSYFYLTNFSYQDLNLWLKEKELLNLTQNVTRQGDTANTLRWAYRYNNLHRRSIYNSHKLTEAKKLLSAGYFDSSSSQNNLWFSDQYARDLTFKKRTSNLTSLTQLRSNWNLLYRSTFGYQNLTNAFKVPTQAMTSDVFTRLSFYESSFHFFLNRIKFFSSLQNHTITSLPTLNQIDSSNHKTFGNIETLYNTTMGTTLSQLNTQVDLFSPNFQLHTTDNEANFQNSTPNNFNKDIVLLSKDADLLTRKANLLVNLTSDFSLQKSTTKTFYYNPNTLYNLTNLTNNYSKTNNVNTKFGFFQK